MKLINISKKYDDKTIFCNLNFECKNNDFVVITGKSGVGKTTFLNILSGLTDFVGQVDFQGNISYMLQQDVFVENLNVFDNLILTTQKSEQEIVEMFSKLQIENILSQFPDELSGGLKRRVSLVRALLKDSDILLLDEPTKSLDDETAMQVVDLIQNDYEKKKRLTFCVTHNAQLFENIATKMLNF